MLVEWEIYYGLKVSQLLSADGVLGFLETANYARDKTKVIYKEDVLKVRICVITNK